MSTASAPPIEERLQAMAGVIHGVIPGAQVRLFGSRARVTSGPEERRQWRSHVIGRALREGRLLDGAL